MEGYRIYLHSSSSKGGERSLQGINSTYKGDSFQGITSASEGDSLGVSEGANAFDFTTSFADVDTDHLNTQIHFD